MDSCSPLSLRLPVRFFGLATLRVQLLHLLSTLSSEQGRFGGRQSKSVSAPFAPFFPS
jgi:hypothetical protein